MEKIVLNNGLRIILEENENSNIASFYVYIGSGSRYERLDNNGVSHFIEHILFKGSEKRSSLEISETMDDIGARYNAFTTKQYTCFYSTVLSKHLMTAMDVLFDMVANPRLNADDIATERGVILEEIAMYEDNPDDVLIDGVHERIWRESLLGKNILGTRETVSAMDEKKIREYIKFAYAPERIVISVGGRFDRAEVVAKIEEYFGSLKNTSNPMQSEKAKYFPSVFVCEKDFEQLNLLIGFKGSHFGHPCYYPLKVLSNILGGSSSSRLFRRIREEKGLAYSVGTASDDYAKEGFFFVMMGISKRNERESLEEAYRILADVKKNGVEQREFNRVKNNMNAAICMSDETPSSRASQYGRSELLYNQVITFAQLAHIYENVTIDQVNEAARTIIDFSGASFGIVGKSLCGVEEYAEFLKKGTL